MLENNFQCLVTFWKCYFPINFSHFLNFQTNFISQNPPPPTHQHPQKPPKRHHPHHHNNNNQKKKKKIKDQREKADQRWDRPRGGDRSASGGRWDWPRGGRDRSSGSMLHVAQSRRDDLNTISPACLVAQSRRLSLSLSLSLSSKSENGLKWK